MGTAYDSEKVVSQDPGRFNGRAMGSRSKSARGVAGLVSWALVGAALVMGGLLAACHSSAPLHPSVDMPEVGDLPPHPFALPQQRSIHVSHFGALGESTTTALYLAVADKEGSFHSTFQERGRARYFLPDGEEQLSLKGGEGFSSPPSFHWDLDPDGSAFWLILARSYLGGDLRAYLVRDDLETHPVNHVRIHNLSEFPLRGLINGASFEITPSGDTVLAYHPDTESHLSFRVEWFYREEWREAYHTSRQIRPGRRINLVCQARINPNIAEGASLIIHTVQERVPETE